MLQAAADTVSQQTEKAEGMKSAYFEASHSKDKKASYSQQKDEFEEVEMREVSFEQQDESDPTSAEIEAANTGFEQMEETKDMETDKDVGKVNLLGDAEQQKITQQMSEQPQFPSDPAQSVSSWDRPKMTRAASEGNLSIVKDICVLSVANLRRNP
ncbi:unnamed protein product [Gongylonema pulchrum]|uniref:Centrosomal protein of 162 kDa n=1 Tax=Gongylonema pulchrum TaxID=637853 RepID=A0A183EMP5_9BILA|nr:unnamed protein product [Gongylonema pulchrum]